MTAPEQAPATALPVPPSTDKPTAPSRAWAWTALALGVAAMVAIASSVLLWQRLQHIQQQLALQTTASHDQSVEARTLARRAEDIARDTSSRMSVLEARVGDIALQRGQMEKLLQNLSRSRDDNLVNDIEGSISFAMQQSLLSASTDPLASALKTAQQRLAKSAQPRLAPLERAIARDLERIAKSQSLDTAGLLARMDDLLRQVDELPLQNAVAKDPITKPAQRPANTPKPPEPSTSTDMTNAPAPAWWHTALTSVWQALRDEASSLVRVRRIDHPDAVLLAPSEAFFLRENLKLRIMNARLGLLSRQLHASRSDLAAASALINKYFDPTARRTQTATLQLQQLQQAMRDVDMPRATDTLAALALAAVGQ